MKKLLSQEIMNLKGANYWLIRDLNNCKKGVEETLHLIGLLNTQINNECELDFLRSESSKVKQVQLGILSSLIDLSCRIDQDIYENGKRIMKLRDMDARDRNQ